MYQRLRELNSLLVGADGNPDELIDAMPLEVSHQDTLLPQAAGQDCGIPFRVAGENKVGG